MIPPQPHEQGVGWATHFGRAWLLFFFVMCTNGQDPSLVHAFSVTPSSNLFSSTNIGPPRTTTRRQWRTTTTTPLVSPTSITKTTRTPRRMIPTSQTALAASNSNELVRMCLCGCLTMLLVQARLRFGWIGM